MAMSFYQARRPQQADLVNAVIQQAKLEQEAKAQEQAAKQQNMTGAVSIAELAPEGTYSDMYNAGKEKVGDWWDTQTAPQEPAQIAEGTTQEQLQSLEDGTTSADEVMQELGMTEDGGATDAMAQVAPDEALMQDSGVKIPEIRQDLMKAGEQVEAQQGATDFGMDAAANAGTDAAAQGATDAMINDATGTAAQEMLTGAGTDAVGNLAGESLGSAAADALASTGAEALMAEGAGSATGALAGESLGAAAADALATTGLGTAGTGAGLGAAGAGAGASAVGAGGAGAAGSAGLTAALSSNPVGWAALAAMALGSLL